MTDQILDHKVRGLKRLLEQYKHQPNLGAILDMKLDRFQDIESALYPLFNALSIKDQGGAMLDIIGELVGRGRTTTDDARYRILIYVKIQENVSKGEPERVITVFKLLTDSPYVHNINLGGAEVQIQVTNPIPTQEEVDLMYLETQNVVADGVRLGLILYADPIEAFACSGNNASAPALGYDDGLGSGGKYATHYINKVPFAYAGGDEGAQGYGAGGADPLAGGVYVV
jgi:hypothetical protein